MGNGELCSFKIIIQKLQSLQIDKSRKRIWNASAQLVDG